MTTLFAELIPHILSPALQVLAVTAPSATIPVTTRYVDLIWTASGVQLAYRVRMFSDESEDVLLYDSGYGVSDNNSHRIPPGYIQNHTRYYLRVDTVWTDGVPYQTALSAFTTEFSVGITPTRPTLDKVGGCNALDGLPGIKITWPAVTASSGCAEYLTQVIPQGDEITDAVRIAGLSGDGIEPPDSSYGIWGPDVSGTQRRNLAQVAGIDVSFDSGTTGFTPGGTNTFALATMGPGSPSPNGKFGQSLWKSHAKLTYVDSFATLINSINLTLTAVLHAFSVWIYIPSDWNGGTIFLAAAGYVGATGTVTANANMALTNQWQRVQLEFTPAGGDLVGSLALGATSAPTVGRAIYVDGVQAENLLATIVGRAQPFTPTTITPVLTAGGLKITSDVINATQGWWAMRFRWGQIPVSAPVMFAWRNIANTEAMDLTYFQAVPGTGYRARSIAGGVTVTIGNGAAIPAKGDLVTLIMSWNATSIGVSSNGGVLATVARGGIPGLSDQPWLGIGSQGPNGAGQYLGGEVKWVAMGTGPLGTPDIAQLNAYGDSEPDLCTLRTAIPNAVATMLWSAENAYYATPKTVTLDQYDVMRRESGETEYTRIAEVAAGTLTYTDYQVRAGQTYEYVIRARMTDGFEEYVTPGSTLSFEQQVFDFAYLHPADDPADYLLFQSLDHTVNVEQDIAFFQPWGQRAPRAQVGEMQAATISLKGLPLYASTQRAWRELLAFLDRQRESGSVLCARFGRGRELYYCQVTEPRMSVGQLSSEITVTLREVEYDIAV